MVDAGPSGPPTIHPQGGIVFSGTAPLVPMMAIQPSGSIEFGGSVPAFSQFTIQPSGSIEFGSTVPAYYGVAYLYPSDGIEFDGGADYQGTFATDCCPEMPSRINFHYLLENSLGGNNLDQESTFDGGEYTDTGSQINYTVISVTNLYCDDDDIKMDVVETLTLPPNTVNNKTLTATGTCFEWVVTDSCQLGSDPTVTYTITATPLGE